MPKSNVLYSSIIVCICLILPIMIIDYNYLDNKEFDAGDLLGSYGEDNHNSIFLNGNDALDNFCSGNGTSGSQSNPHVIKDYIIDAKTDGYAIWLQNVSLHLIIKNCTIYDGYYGNKDGILIIKCANVTITNCTVKSCDTGMTIFKSTKCVCNDTFFFENDYGCIVNGSQEINLTRLTGFEKESEGLRILNSSQIEIHKSIIIVGAGNGITVEVKNSNSTVIADTFFFAKYICTTYSTETAITVYDSQIKIINNTFTPDPSLMDSISMSNPGSMIGLIVHRAELILNNNRFESIYKGISVQDSSLYAEKNIFSYIPHFTFGCGNGTAEIINNTILGCGSGISCGIMKNLTVRDCVIDSIVDSGTTYGNGIGLYLIGISSFTDFDLSNIYYLYNNTITDCSSYGIRFFRTLATVYITNSSISRSGMAGIRIDETNNQHVLTNNIISNNGGHGVWLTETCHNVTISGNTFEENGGFCIYDCGTNNIYYDNYNCNPITYTQYIWMWVGFVLIIIVIIIVISANRRKKSLP